MNRTGKFSFVVVLAAVTACGSNEPPAPGAGGAAGNNPSTGGKGGSTASGGTGGTGGTNETGGSGGSNASGGSGGAPSTAEYFPFKVGNTWEYEVSEPNVAKVTKVHKIVRMEKVGAGPDKDVMAYYVETQKKGAATAFSDATRSWQIRQGTRIVRYREISCTQGSVMNAADGTVTSCTVNEEDTWSPPRVRIDEKPMGMDYSKGLKWPEMYTESKTSITFKTTPPTMMTTMATNTENWEVVDVGVKAASPAGPNGEFSDCVVLRKTSARDVPKTYTFCRGVGKVREEGSLGQLELLTKYTLP